MSKAAWILFGYLSGSILYARIFAKLFRKEDMIEKSRDRNPGAGNAFMYGGFWCGVLTLTCDILKGFFPVYLFMQYAPDLSPDMLSIAFVMAAPVVGHAFPVFFKGKGGKGIAVTFGCLLGLFPFLRPFAILAAFFIFFSCILRINPHYYRTLAAYLCALIGMLLLVKVPMILLGFAIIAVVVSSRMLLSEEEKEKMRIKLLWMH
ncbi:MAG: glycerol-3-phosphate acyltransferase [Agathobacter sp.]